MAVLLHIELYGLALVEGVALELGHDSIRPER